MESEISYREKSGKFTDMWRWKNMLLNNQCWSQDKLENILKLTPWKHNLAILRDAAEALLTEEFIAIHANFKKNLQSVI